MYSPDVQEPGLSGDQEMIQAGDGGLRATRGNGSRVIWLTKMLPAGKKPCSSADSAHPPGATATCNAACAKHWSQNRDSCGDCFSPAGACPKCDISCAQAACWPSKKPAVNSNTSNVRIKRMGYVFNYWRVVYKPTVVRLSGGSWQTPSGFAWKPLPASRSRIKRHRAIRRFSRLFSVPC